MNFKSAVRPISLFENDRKNGFDILLRADNLFVESEVVVMANESRCSSCDEYDQKGSNYCRRCGFHLRAGKAEYVAKATTYNLNEKYCDLHESYCGNCGSLPENCHC